MLYLGQKSQTEKRKSALVELYKIYWDFIIFKYCNIKDIPRKLNLIAFKLLYQTKLVNAMQILFIWMLLKQQEIFFRNFGQLRFWFSNKQITWFFSFVGMTVDMKLLNRYFLLFI